MDSDRNLGDLSQLQEIVTNMAVVSASRQCAKSLEIQCTVFNRLMFTLFALKFDAKFGGAMIKEEIFQSVLSAKVTVNCGSHTNQYKVKQKITSKQQLLL